MLKYNPIEIEDFPELEEILSSDSIIVFEEKEETISPKLCKVGDLSSVIVLDGSIDDLVNKANEIKGMIASAIANLRKNFVSIETAASTYATISEMETQLNMLKNTADFLDDLKNKADSKYLDYLYNRLKKANANMKFFMGTGDWGSKGSPKKNDGSGYKLLLAQLAGGGEL